MSDTLSNLEPRSLWNQFRNILAIPRTSGHEEKISDYIRDFAGEYGFRVEADKTGNLVVNVPATPGHESAPVVVLQNHMDMVGEKNKDTVHDFLTDPIVPRVDGEWVAATGTTLGADNGIGAAAALAAAIDPGIVHGPLEILLTVDEESGLTGAKGLDSSMLTGRTMLNLDSEEDGAIYVGCAGGCDIHLTLSPEWVDAAPDANCVSIEVTGLRGGHSGLDIGENRGNALKILVRLLNAMIKEGIPLEISRLTGGDKHNAIPREAEAHVMIDSFDVDRLESVRKNMMDAFRAELQGVDESLEITISSVPAASRRLSSGDRDRLLRLLSSLPHGVLGMSNDLEGLVETSTNLAAVKIQNDTFLVLTSSRSSVMPALDSVLESIQSIGHLAGTEVEVQIGYPGWKPNMDSAVLQTVKKIYSRLWDSPLKITAIHAGLECGLLGEQVPGMDMVSFGPQIEGAHSPEERVNIPSVGRFWNALKVILGELASV